jgi:hypothetical protein
LLTLNFSADTLFQNNKVTTQYLSPSEKGAACNGVVGGPDNTIFLLLFAPCYSGTGHIRDTADG